MATKTKQTYIGEELEWLEEQLKSLKKYVDDNPIGSIEDRTIVIAGARGNVESVVATKEQQITSVKNVLKDLPALLEAIDKLRENEQKKIAVRGKGSVPSMMEED